MRPLAALLALPLLACGTPAPEGDSTTERASLLALAPDAAPVAQLSLTAWSSGLLQASVEATALPTGDYALRVYDFGTCALVREKASNPVLETSGSRSVLPIVATVDGLQLGAGPATGEAAVRALRGDLDVLDGRPAALVDAQDKVVACGEISATATAAR